MTRMDIDDDLLMAAILRGPPDERLRDAAKCLRDVRVFVAASSRDASALGAVDRLIAIAEERARKRSH
jgi:hypothetical protein